MKKLFIGVSVLLIVSIITNIGVSFAQSQITEGKALKLAEQYIQNSLSDEAWKDNNPQIVQETPFYVDNEKKTAYIEYKVSCTSTPDCGFILMNVDKNDVAVPIASPTGKTPSEILNISEGEETYYYFSPFDIYSKNKETGLVQAIDPKKSLKIEDLKSLKLNTEEKETLEKQKISLKEELKNAKIAAKEFKKSKKFQEKKAEIQDQIFVVPEEEFSMKMLPVANAATYTSPGSSNSFISGGSYTTGCNGKTPCYEQFSKWYWGCDSGCSPTAMGIIFGWYDRNGFPNLLPGTASRTNNSDVKNMIISIRNYMETECKGGEGVTDEFNIYKGIQFAKDKGYLNANSQTFLNATPYSTYMKVVDEVSSNRPVIVNVADNNDENGHSIVAFGYRSVGFPFVIRVNMGYGGGNKYGSYFSSNLDQNLSSVFYDSSYNHSPYSINTVRIN